MRFLFYFLAQVYFCFTLVACSLGLTTEVESLNSDQYLSLRKNDYVGHLNWFGTGFAKNSHTIILPRAEQDYLKSLIEIIKVANPKITKGLSTVQIKFIKDREPYHFSLPNGNIYVSTELLKTLIDSEAALATLLCLEIVRINFQMYQKYQIIPQGLFEMDEIVKFFKTSIAERVEHNKWTFYCLENAGFDPSVVLGWIQKQNKLAGSAWFRDDVKTLSLEESHFKSFLISRLKEGYIEQKDYEKSDRRFYKLLNVLRPINDQI